MKSEDFLKTILEQLVDYPEQISVVRSNDLQGTLLSVRVAPPDMGKIIGREGVTAKAIKHLINCHGFRQEEKVSVKIFDPVTA